MLSSAILHSTEFVPRPIYDKVSEVGYPELSPKLLPVQVFAQCFMYFEDRDKRLLNIDAGTLPGDRARELVEGK